MSQESQPSAAPAAAITLGLALVATAFILTHNQPRVEPLIVTPAVQPVAPPQPKCPNCPNCPRRPNGDVIPDAKAGQAAPAVTPPLTLDASGRLVCVTYDPADAGEWVLVTPPPSDGACRGSLDGAGLGVDVKVWRPAAMKAGVCVDLARRPGNDGPLTPGERAAIDDFIRGDFAGSGHPSKAAGHPADR